LRTALHVCCCVTLLVVAAAAWRVLPASTSGRGQMLLHGLLCTPTAASRQRSECCTRGGIVESRSQQDSEGWCLSKQLAAHVATHAHLMPGGTTQSAARIQLSAHTPR
jgi:hypothetical protein